MSFFVTSVGKGDGANLGGLAGADAHCQALAKAAGQGGDAVWRAYLSTQGAGAVSARDRIGNGPWHNFRGQVISANIGVLHGDTIEQARIGNPLGKQLALTEKGELVNGVGDKPNQHDILTGSTAGRPRLHRRRRPHLQQLDEQQRRFGAGRTQRQAGRRQQLVELHPSEQGLQPGQPGRHRRRGTLLLLRGQIRLQGFQTFQGSRRSKAAESENQLWNRWNPGTLELLRAKRR